MNRQKFDNIIAKFGAAWVSRDPDSLMSLISRNDLRYFETNFDPPLTDWAKVKKLWDIVPNNQTDITWHHEILLAEENKVLAHVQLSRTLLPSRKHQIIDAAFLFGFDEDNKINYFRQWRSIK